MPSIPSSYIFFDKVPEKNPRSGVFRLPAWRLWRDPGGLALYLAGVRARSGSRASFGGDPPGTRDLHPDQQSENGFRQTCPQSFFGPSEAVLTGASVWQPSKPSITMSKAREPGKNHARPNRQLDLLLALRTSRKSARANAHYVQDGRLAFS